MKALKLLKFVICLLVISNFAYADDDIRKITVTGKSTITLEAQYSIIHTEVKHVNPEMDKSHKELQQTLFAIIEKLKKIGLSDKEITKSIVRQGSEFTWENNSKKHVGYYSSSNMRLRVNDLSKLPQVYNELSKYDSLTIRSTEYGRNDEFAKRNEEFKKALDAAKTKARLMAKSLDAKIGTVLRIAEISSQNYFTGNIYSNAATVSRKENGAAFGSVEITASVTVDFELK